MPAQFTTDLPDASGLSLDATTQSEMTASWDDTTNNGEYRIEGKEEEADTETSYSSANSATVGPATTAYTIANLLDGEKYSVRIRTQTDHVTGSWLEAADVTKLISADVPTVSGTSTTSIAIDWIRNSDFEGSQPIYRKRTDYDYPDGDLGRLVGTAGASETSFTDDSAHPNRSYTYHVRALTQWVHADSPLSDPIEADSLGLEQRAVPPRGWHAEVEHPSGGVRQLSIADGAQWQPQLNGLPRVRLPAPRDETWRSDVYEGQPLRVWYNGRRLPIDELETVTTDEGRTVLEGRGGLQLQQTVDTEYSSRAAHLAVEELIQQETDYAANVNAPSAEVSIDNELLLKANTTGEWQDLAVFGDTDPIEASGGTLEVLETAYFNRGLLNTSSFEGTLRNHVDYINGEGLHLTSSGDYAEWPFSFGYDIPAERVGLAVRNEVLNSTDAEWSYNGQTIGDFSISQAFHNWEDLRNGFYSVDHSVSTIPAGETQTLRVDITGDADYVADAIFVYDTKYYPSVDEWADEGWNAVHEDNGHLDGPPTHPPDGAQVRTDDAETPYSVVGADVAAVLNDITGPQKLEVSNDQGVSWLEAPNSETLDQSFADDGGTLRARFTLGGYGSRNDASPRFGYQPQTVDSAEVRADLEDTPVLVNQTFEGNLGDVLSEIADQGDFIWEVRRDDGYSIEWTRAGQRQTTADLDVSSYEDTVTIESKTLACEVVGGHQSVSVRQFTADTQSFVSLGNTDIIAGTEYVYDPETSEGYDRGQDYEINNRDGAIRATESGAMNDGDTYAVDYEYKPRGHHEADEWDGDATYERREEIPGLTSRRGCQQAALRIIQETRDGLTEADVQFADLNPDQSLVEAINLDALPGDDPLEVREIDFADGQSQALLGDGQSVGDAVNEIRSRIDAVAKRS